MDLNPHDRRRLLSWRRSLQIRNVDLVNDFVGKDLFGIHGEALVAHCIPSGKVDYEDGYQLLHAVHAIERFLNELRQRGCNFHILWFDDYQKISVPLNEKSENSHKYLLTRAVFKAHFGAVLVDKSQSDIISFEFSSVTDEAFVQYLTTKSLRFIMCSGASTDANGEFLLSHVAFSRFFADQGSALGFIEDIEFKSSKVYLSLVAADAPSLAWPDPKFKPSPQQTQDLPWVRLALQLEKHSQWDTLEINLRQKLSLIACAAVVSNESTYENRRHAAAFVAHNALLERVSLSQRTWETPRESPGASFCFFLQKISHVAVALIQNWSVAQLMPSADLLDLIDGRLFQHVLQGSNAKRIANLVSQSLSVLDVLTESAIFHGYAERYLQHVPGSKGLSPETQYRQVALLPFEHEVFDPFLEPVRISTHPAAEIDTTIKIFQDRCHWHNAKSPLKPMPGPIRPMDKRMSRRNQMMMANTIAYSASLTNGSGKTIDPEVVVVQTKENTRPGCGQKEQKEHKGKTPRNGKKIFKAKKLSGKEKAFEAARLTKAKKLADKSLSVTHFWDKRCQEFEEEPNVIQRYVKVKAYFEGLQEAEKQTIGAEVLLYSCKLLISAQKVCRYGVAQDWSIIALAWSTAQEMLDRPMSLEVRQKAEKITTALGIVIDGIVPQALCFTTPRKLPFIISSADAKNLPPIDYLDLQLEHCGPYLKRSFDSRPDSRVPFAPDAWQRDVLDAIDRNHSLFVVAPTSAGKTFISFYAMKKVLQSNDEDILVYLAPTKALVNQIAAEVQARFSKSYRYSGKSVWAVHTRDYRINNPTGCQVLVTVPHILQIMLLSPSNALEPDSWSRRVKRIIFDEVHCIGQAEDGIIWEQLLLLAPCPIIALSATVGNPTEFYDWLSGTQEAKGFTLTMVTHSFRYSDLRKFIYNPPKEKLEFVGFESLGRLPLPGLDASGDGETQVRFAYMHPIASILSKDKATLEHASLEPRDCLRLWRAMKTTETKPFPLDDRVNPQKFLPKIVTKPDVVKWEASLKEQLYCWMAASGSPFDQCQKSLRGNPDNATCNNNHNIDFSLLKDLRDRSALPAILFSYDRDNCEKFMHGIFNVLQTAEEKYRQTNPAWRRRMKAFEKWKTDAFKTVARPERQPGANKTDMIREETSREPSPFASFHADDPIAEFSFADMKKTSRAEFQDLVRSINAEKVKPEFIDALWRGVAVHHSGMNHRYRQVVELLFRRGVITVVIATGTLALGINMPCKTVVFIGDSIFLTALNYRQCSGRAGRRGFDVLGNVVFHGIPHHRVMDIMSAKLPDLRGSFPVSVILILRIFGLLHETKNSEYAINAVKSLFSQNRLHLGGEASRMSIVHHLRFSIEYLRRQKLLSAKGEPINLAGLVGHLYFTENAIFAFHSVLQGGYLSELCADIHSEYKRTDILRELMLVLCHLFCRIPCKQATVAGWLSETARSSPSIIALPELPQAAKASLDAHNKDTLEIFKSYVYTYAQQHLGDAIDDMLPFTKQHIGPRSPGDVVNLAELGIPTLPQPVVRSPFAALSGHGDSFTSIHELVTTVRAGVFLDESAIPYIPIYPEETDHVPLNAYILDFFKHGDLTALVRDNGIKRGEVWHLLQNFSRILSSIVASLAGYLWDSSTADEKSGSHTSSDEDKEKSDVNSKERTKVKDDGFFKVYTALRLLRDEFDERFMKVWA